MCLAILSKPGANIPAEYLATAATNNPDGFGYAFNYAGKVVTRKWLKYDDEAEVVYEMDRRANPDAVFLVHFRMATHGDLCLKNTHPFVLQDGGAMIHNGIIDIKGLPEGYSDSRFFAKHIVSKLPANWQYQAWWVQVLEDYISPWNKVCFVWPNGSWLILHEDAGDWDEGNWYSNSSHKRRVWRMSDYWWEDNEWEQDSAIDCALSKEYGETIAQIIRDGVK